MATEQPEEQWSQLVQTIKQAVSSITFDGDQQAVTHPRTIQRFVDAVAASGFAAQTGFRLLDTASAGGEPGLSLAHAFPSAKITITDYSPACVAWATERSEEQGLRSKVTLAVANGESMPQFADTSFDIVTSSYGLMFYDHVKGLREMHRVLKPGGLLLVANWAPADQLDFALITSEVLASVAPGTELPMLASRLGDVPLFRRCLSEAGFVDIRVSEFQNPFSFAPGKAEPWCVNGTPLTPVLNQLEAAGQSDVKERAAAAVRAAAEKNGLYAADGSIVLSRNLAHFYAAVKGT